MVLPIDSLCFIKRRSEKEVSAIVHIIADPHLGESVDKPMRVFGSEWEDHVRKFKEAWLAQVAPEDTVFLPGDISWGIDLNEALADFLFLEQLPGKKILSKGNHDYWWTTLSKMQKFLDDNALTTISFLHNDAVAVEGMIVCGSKGYLWDAGEPVTQNEKLIRREAARLELSLKAGRKLRKTCPGYETAELVVVLHYPPLTVGQRNEPILSLLHEYDIKRCYFGHIHGPGKAAAVTGEVDGVSYFLVSADFLSFCPQKMNKNSFLLRDL